MQGTQWRPAAAPRNGFLPAVNISGARRQPMFGQFPTFGGNAALAQRQQLQLAGRQQLGRPYLGQTPEEWYRRAGAALARYDFLKNQIATIDNQSARESIRRWLGTSEIPGTAEYRYVRVKDDYVGDVGRIGIQATYSEDRRTGRIEELEDYNVQLNDKIRSAQSTHGTRPSPTGDQGDKGDRGAPAPDYTVPILIGAGAVVLVLGLNFAGVFKAKK